MFDLDTAIVGWRRELSDAGVKPSAWLNELENHLREDVAQQIRSGMKTQQAFETAVRSIGHAQALKTEFAKAAQMKRARFGKYLLPAFGIGAGLFLAGISFAYFVMLPAMMATSRQYATWLGFSASFIDAQAYKSFVYRFGLGMGLAFLMPAVLLLLVQRGILDRQKMIRLRRYVIPANLVLGALLTTPEVLTQLLMFAVLQSPYELTILIIARWERKEHQYV